MNTFDKSIKHFRNLLIYGVLFLLGILLFQFFYQCDANPITVKSMIVDIVIGFISALILLILIETKAKKQDQSDFGYLAGKYKRHIRGNEQPDPNARWKEVKNADDPNIELIYKGNRTYEIPSINYDDKWYARATIFIDATNKKYGSGVYQYHILSDTIPEDFGKFELFVDELNDKKIYIFHQNYLPSGRSNGYEIFIRQ